VSRSNLNPSYLHNTTGTFNLIVKDRSAFRLSGAFQSSSSIHHLVASGLSSKPFKPTKLFLLLSTCHPQPRAGSANIDRKSTIISFFATLGKPLPTRSPTEF
jgi:hypothetical protein